MFAIRNVRKPKTSGSFTSTGLRQVSVNTVQQKTKKPVYIFLLAFNPLQSNNCLSTNKNSIGLECSAGGGLYLSSENFTHVIHNFIYTHMTSSFENTMQQILLHLLRNIVGEEAELDTLRSVVNGIPKQNCLNVVKYYL